MKGIDVSKEYIGLEEVRDGQEITHLLNTMSHDGDITVVPSKTSWCAAWINFCERSVGNPGTGKLNAQSFNTYGEEIDQDDAEEGDIVVFHFPFDSDWQGHVTYFSKWDDDTNQVECLGGNQGNAIKYNAYSQDYIKHIRRYK